MFFNREATDVRDGVLKQAQNNTSVNIKCETDALLTLAIVNRFHDNLQLEQIFVAYFISQSENKCRIILTK